MIKQCRAMAIVLLSLSLAPGAFAAQENEATPVYVDNKTGLKFPRRLGPLDFVNTLEYPEKNLGYCVRYASPQDHGQLCVYDQGNANLQTGIDSDDFRQEFDGVVGATLGVLATHPYHDGKVMLDGTPSISADEKTAEAKMKMFTSKLALLDGSDQNNMHLVFMTIGLKKIVKLNYSAKNMSPADFTQRSRDILEAFIRFNGATMEAFLVDRESKAE